MKEIALIIIGYITGALLFMHMGCRLMLILIAKPDKAHPLNPQSTRRTLAVLIGGFGGVGLWTMAAVVGWLLWRAHVMSEVGSG